MWCLPLVLWCLLHLSISTCLQYFTHGCMYIPNTYMFCTVPSSLHHCQWSYQISRKRPPAIPAFMSTWISLNFNNFVRIHIKMNPPRWITLIFQYSKQYWLFILLESWKKLNFQLSPKTFFLYKKEKVFHVTVLYKWSEETCANQESKSVLKNQKFRNIVH